MLIRALIVLLLVLNIGVATWWLTRASPEPAAVAAPSSAPSLQLVDGSRPVPTAVAAPAPEAPVAPTDLCISFGPFASAEAAAEARQRVRPVSERMRIREIAAGPNRGWKVWLPPYAGADEVEAVAARVAAAGFIDRFVVREGPDANSLALGRFASEAPARQHAAALVAAGFPARVEPIGTGRVSHWLDVSVDPESASRLRPLAAAREARELDCATWP